MTFVTTPSAPRSTTGPEERVAVLLAGEGHDVAVGRDELQGRDRRRQVAVPDARAVRRGGAGTGDGDVGQGGEVVQREALLVEIGAQLAVASSRPRRSPCGAFGSSATTRSIGSSEMRAWGLSAMPLKQWRVPEHPERIVLPDVVADLLDRLER